MKKFLNPRKIPRGFLAIFVSLLKICTVMAVGLSTLPALAGGEAATDVSYELGIVNSLIDPLYNLSLGPSLSGGSPKEYFSVAGMDRAAVAVYSINKLPGELFSKLQSIMDKIDSKGFRENSFSARCLFQFGSSIILLKWIEERKLPIKEELKESLEDNALVWLRNYLLENRLVNGDDSVSEGAIENLAELFALFNSEFDQKLAQRFLARWQSLHPKFDKKNNFRAGVKLVVNSFSRGLSYSYTSRGWGEGYFPLGIFLNLLSWAGVTMTSVGYFMSTPWLMGPGLLVTSGVTFLTYTRAKADVEQLTRENRLAHNYRLVGEKILKDMYMDKKQSICMTGLLSI